MFKNYLNLPLPSFHVDVEKLICVGIVLLLQIVEVNELIRVELPFRVHILNLPSGYLEIVNFKLL